MILEFISPQHPFGQLGDSLGLVAGGLIGRVQFKNLIHLALQNKLLFPWLNGRHGPGAGPEHMYKIICQNPGFHKGSSFRSCLFLRFCRFASDLAAKTQPAPTFPGFSGAFFLNILGAILKNESARPVSYLYPPQILKRLF